MKREKAEEAQHIYIPGMLKDNEKTLSMYNYINTTRCVGTDKKEKKHA